MLLCLWWALTMINKTTRSSCQQCLLHHQLLGLPDQNHPWQLWHHGGTRDHSACHHCHPEDQPQMAPLGNFRVDCPKHHPCIYKHCQDWIGSSLTWPPVAPTTKVTVMGLSCHLEKAVQYDDTKKVVKQASEDQLRSISGYTEDHVASCNVTRNTHSSKLQCWGWHYPQRPLCQAHFLVWQWIWLQHQGRSTWLPRSKSLLNHRLQ